ncbi:MAG TPA: CoA transferase [Acidimicrobiia bacterium]|jgi:crotonobetainyl-CoA:carnitine CoA-transferase CaiB-like acyl-CoA transferase|nr:CoA transferase [Acidimicrobiia bacterium]
MSGPLTGLRVIDVGQLIAAPLTATLLADFGADVVKVERPGVGDAGREMGPRKGDIPLWWKVNGRNKRSIALDLKDDADREIFRRLVEQADVLVENFAVGVMDRLGLGYETLREWNPGLVQLSVSGFGQTGPRRHSKGFGRNAEAFSGMAYTTGYPDRPPIHLAFPVADSVSGIFGAFAVLAALRERETNPTGEGQMVDLALYEAVFRLMEFTAIAYDQLGEVTEREGARSTYVAPVNTWRTKDGKWASFTGSTQAMVERLFRAIGRPDLLTDPRFLTNKTRMAHRDELDEILSAWMADHILAEVTRIFDEHQVAIAPVYSIADIFAEPHYWAREAIIEVEDDELGPVRMQGVVPKFSRTPGAVRHTGPRIDQDRESILADWLAEAVTGGEARR